MGISLNPLNMAEVMPFLFWARSPAIQIILRSESISIFPNPCNSFLIAFERDSVVPKEDQILESLKDMSLRALMEQEGEEDDAAEEAEDADQDHE